MYILYGIIKNKEKKIFYPLYPDTKFLDFGENIIKTIKRHSNKEFEELSERITLVYNDKLPELRPSVFRRNLNVILKLCGNDPFTQIENTYISSVLRNVVKKEGLEGYFENKDLCLGLNGTAYYVNSAVYAKHAFFVNLDTESLDLLYNDITKKTEPFSSVISIPFEEIRRGKINFKDRVFLETLKKKRVGALK